MANLSIKEVADRFQIPEADAAAMVTLKLLPKPANGKRSRKAEYTEEQLEQWYNKRVVERLTRDLQDAAKLVERAEPESLLCFAVLRQAISDYALRKGEHQASARWYLLGDMPHAQLLGLSPGWIRSLMDSRGIKVGRP